MPSREHAQEDLCQLESIPRWSLPIWELLPGMLFQSQDTPLKYTRTIDKLHKIKDIEKSMPSREDAQEDLCQPVSIPRW